VNWRHINCKYDRRTCNTFCRGQPAGVDAAVVASASAYNYCNAFLFGSVLCCSVCCCCPAPCGRKHAPRSHSKDAQGEAYTREKMSRKSKNSKQYFVHFSKIFSTFYYYYLLLLLLNFTTFFTPTISLLLFHYSFYTTTTLPLLF